MSVFKFINGVDMNTNKVYFADIYDSKEKYYTFSNNAIGSIYIKGRLVPFNSVVPTQSKIEVKRKFKKFNEYENK